MVEIVVERRDDGVQLTLRGEDWTVGFIVLSDGERQQLIRDLINPQ